VESWLRLSRRGEDYLVGADSISVHRDGGGLDCFFFPVMAAVVKQDVPDSRRSGISHGL